MARITRRTILKLSGTVAARTGGLAAILATGRAPALAQAKTVHWLRWADFVPASDQLLKGQITEECQKATSIKLEVETINANDIQARITSSIQSGAGPDIFMTLNNWPQLYAQSCADVGDIADELGKAQGGFYDICELCLDSRWQMDRGAMVRRRYTHRLPQVIAGRGRVRRQVPRHVGSISYRGPKAEKIRPTLWPNCWAHLRRRAGMVVSVPLVVGWQGGRGRWQDRCARQQGDARIGQVRRTAVEGDDGR